MVMSSRYRAIDPACYLLAVNKRWKSRLVGKDSRDASISGKSRWAESVRPRALAALFLSLFSLAGLSQSSSAIPDPLLSLSPHAAYAQALSPVEIVHRSIDNWSDSETASLAVAIAQAQKFCNARPATQFTGPDLLGLAQLCALGVQWPAVREAANRFLAATPPPPAGTPSSTAPSTRALALAYQVEAALNLGDPETAVSASTELLTSEPYTSLSQQSSGSVLRYLQLVQTGTAIVLAGKRLDRILPLLSASGTAAKSATLPAGSPVRTPATSQPATQSAAAASPALPLNVLSAHELYTAALDTPTLLQLSGSTAAAIGTLATIEAAVPTQLSPDEVTLIALARRRYSLLGAPLPTFPVTASLRGSGSDRINAGFGAATVLLVFPDWCAQCVRMASRDTLAFLGRHTEDNIHLYALLAQAAPSQLAHTQKRPTHTQQPPTPAHPPSPDELLRGTPTLTVPASVPLSTFASTDFPLLLVTDHEGRIRFLGVAPDNAFAEGSLADQLLARIAGIWPST